MGYYATPCVAYGKKPEFYYADVWDLMTASEKGKHALAPATPSVFFDKLYWGLIDSRKWQPNNPSTPLKTILFFVFYFFASSPLSWTSQASYSTESLILKLAKPSYRWDKC